MPRSVVYALMIEIVLIFFTTVCLLQPKRFFPWQRERIRSIFFGVGVFLLCLTFCWSLIVGILFSMNDLTFGL